MAKKKETAEDLQTVTRTPAAVTGLPGSRLDYGDAAYDELDGLDEFALDEPIELVDAPVPLREPLTRTRRKRRRHRS